MPRSTITIRDVAAHAGVSRQTVSRVINGSERVSDTTRATVQASIEELGYSPNAIAQIMAKGKTATLACIAPNLTDYTFASIIDGAETTARQHGYFLMSSSAPDEQAFSDLIEELVRSRRVEGLLVINPYIDGRFTHIPPHIPLVFAGARPRGGGISSVALDDVAVAYTATQHLLSLGHRHIAQITGPMQEDCAQDRSEGFARALEEAGLQASEMITLEGDWTAGSGEIAFWQIIQEGGKPTAVFAQNDQMAIGVLQAARRSNIIIPDQLSVIGVDDIPLAAYLSPPLTTLQQNFANIGGQAANLLIQAIEQPHPQPQQLRIPATLLIRQSTKTLEGGDV